MISEGRDPVTYRISFYLQTAGVAAQGVLATVLDSVHGEGSGVQVSDEKGGAAWASAYASSSEAPRGRVMIEVHSDPELVQEMVADVVHSDGSGRVGESDAVATLTLIGDHVDWNLVRLLWKSIEVAYAAIPYAEASGFGVTIEDL